MFLLWVSYITFVVWLVGVVMLGCFPLLYTFDCGLLCCICLLVTCWFGVDFRWWDVCYFKVVVSCSLWFVVLYC